jgi:phosphoribosylformylglycinamidine cyclo-ligase
MSANNDDGTLTYQHSGVDIGAGETLVEHIKTMAASTLNPAVLAGIGGFGALYELPMGRYKNPCLVCATDGVGTKLLLAKQLQQYHSIGIDLVAMCVNDIIVQGAQPLLFLDYYASGKLHVDIAKEVVSGIARGCQLAGAALVGGETAEMPGLYAKDDYDLAGFCVGVVEKNRIIDGPKHVQAGDQIIGLASSGVHSNGFSLVHHLVKSQGISWHQPFGNSTLGEQLLTPTRIYVKPLLKLLDTYPVHAMAHITGGGLLDNLPRVMPSHSCAVIDSQSWRRPAIFEWLQARGQLTHQTLWQTFNCGVGMALIVPPNTMLATIDLLQQMGETAWHMGTIIPIDSPQALVRVTQSP